jgi:hypothetical protein
LLLDALRTSPVDFKWAGELTMIAAEFESYRKKQDGS